MSINIEHKNLFKMKLQTGISLFTGAGFSTLASPSNYRLPTGTELSDEIITHFSLPDLSKENGLEYISEFCPKNEYQEYLRKRFTVKDYNPLYNAINRIKLKALITTNIDNILRLAINSERRYYLKSIREYGAATNDPNELVFIPLHGDVTDYSSKLFFGKFDLSNVDLINRDLFAQMQGVLSNSAVLFWGYSFNDAGVLRIVNNLIEKNSSSIWVQVLPTDKTNKKLFKEKGCHIIEADTESLLQWIKNNGSYVESSYESPIEDPALNKYLIPSILQIPVIPAKDYYQQGATEWYPIITGVPYERSLVSEVEDLVLDCKNVIISGCRFSGKTTMLMQLAKKVDCKNKFYVDGITKEEADFLVKKTDGKETWFFFNNCCRDIEAFLVFAKSSNVKIIGTSDDYLLETVKHMLSQNISYKIVNCSEISESEARKMYEGIPNGLRKKRFTYKSQKNEKYTMFEFVSKNIEKAYTQQYILTILKGIKSQNEELFKIIAIASYLSQFGSAISYQNVAHLLDINVYPEAFKMVKQAEVYLRTYNFSINIESEKQDFYILRSKIFNLCAWNILIEKYRDEFGYLIKWFTTKESSYAVFRYDIFQRKALDAALFKKVFSYDDAMEIYNYLYEKEHNPYILQQKALCQSLFGYHANAFSNIDKALNLWPNNFSFKNSQAIILFESNHSNHCDDSIEYMKQAMTILDQCYNNDKRKLYHAQKYAEFSLILSNDYKVDDYLKTAINWLNEMTGNDNSDSRRTRKLKEELSNKLATVQNSKDN